MTYDISIKADHSCSRTTEQQSLIRFLTDVVGLLPDSENHFRIVDHSGLNYGDVDLSATRQEETPHAINCIQVHIRMPTRLKGGLRS